MLDLGDDALTQGRAHPMIDQRSRLDRIAVEAADPTCAVLLLDVVLGHGAHPDPAAELAPALAAARRTAADAGRELAVVVSLCGTADDPQGPRRQADALHGAGAAVFLSNAAAARHAVSPRHGRPDDSMTLLDGPPRVVAVGAQLFADALTAQAVRGDPGRLAAAAGRRRHRGSSSPGCSPTRGAPRRTPRRSTGCSPPAPSWSTSGPRPRRWAWARGVPARRPADRLGPRRPARCAAR